MKHADLRPEFSRRSCAALAASTIGLSLAGITTLAFPVFLTSIAAEFGGRGRVTALYTIAALAGYAGMPLVGAAVDRWGGRRVTPLLAAASALAAALIGVSRPFGLPGLVMLFALAGICNSTMAAYSKLNAGWFHRRRGLAFALSGVGVGLVWMLVIPQSAMALLRHFDWRTCYGIMGLAGLFVGAPLVALLARDPPPSPEPEAKKGVSAPSAWRSAVFWLVIVGVCAETATVNSCRSQMVALLTDRGVSHGLAVSILSTSLAGTLISQPLAGWLLDRFDSPKLVLPFAGCSLAGVLLLALGPDLPAWVLGNVLMSLGYSAEVLMAPYFFTRFFGAREHGKIYGSMFVCLAPITATAPWAMGGVFDRTGSYLPMLLIFAVALALGAVCFALLPAYRFGPRPVARFRRTAPPRALIG